MIKKLNESFKEKINKPLLIISFVIYLIIVIWIIFFKCCIPSLNEGHIFRIKLTILESFKTTCFYFPTDYSIALTVVDIFCNLLILLPLGIYLPVLFKKVNFLRDLIITLALTISFETIQLFTRMGYFSFYDLLFNTTGMLIGEFIYYKLQAKFTYKVINYIQLFVVILFLPIVIYSIISVPLNWNVFSPIFDFEKYPYILK